MINQQQAQQIASDWVVAHPARGRDRVLEMCVLDEHTREFDFGWVFFYTPRLWHETGDFEYAVAGNAPLIVDRRDGSLHPTGTALPVDQYIEEYRCQRAL